LILLLVIWGINVGLLAELFPNHCRIYWQPAISPSSWCLQLTILLKD